MDPSSPANPAAAATSPGGAGGAGASGAGNDSSGASGAGAGKDFSAGAAGGLCVVDVSDGLLATTAPTVAAEVVVRCPPGMRFRHAARRLGHHLRLRTKTVSTVRVAVTADALTATLPPPTLDPPTALALATAPTCTSPDDLSNTEALGLCWYAATGCAACARVAAELLPRFNQ